MGRPANGGAANRRYCNRMPQDSPLAGDLHNATVWLTRRQLLHTLALARPGDLR